MTGRHRSIGLEDDWVVTSANVDLARSIFTPWERGEFGSSEWAHPEVEFVVADGPNPGRWIGVEGMREGMRDFASPWEDLRVEAEEYQDVDRERVLVLGHNTGRGRGSGLELGQMRTRGAVVFRFQGGAVTRVTLYYDRDNAFADLGLAAEGKSG